jgi:hypothetical protein
MVDGTAMSTHGSEPGPAGTYDVAQIISNDEDYVGFVAHWPSVSDWTVDAGDDDIWWKRMIAADPHATDGATEPWLAPLVVGEWDFILADTGGEGEDLGNGVNVADQFRGVSVYGVTDRNDGDDADYGSTDLIDREVMYQLDKHFNPWSLVDAVAKKDTSRWVEFFSGNGITKVFTLDYTPLDPATMAAGWDEYSNFSERVLVNGMLQIPNREIPPRTPTTYRYTLSGDTISFNIAPPAGMNNIKVLYSTNDTYEIPDEVAFGPGRYEWTTVGRDAASVDSAGAALVTASIKQKNITIGLAGEDMWDTELANQIPYIMNQFGTGATMTDYMDSIGRAALNDDWCTYWPVASSNILGVGGPIANMLAYYSNDFTDAIYGMPDYSTGSPYSSMITGLACWQRYWDDITTGPKWNVYESNSTHGYAVISTYIDKNGTEVLEVWGHWGRDTYYATQWLHGDAARDIDPGIVQLQEAPAGLTSIILEINYGMHPKHPTFSIPECLGTISETEWDHQGEIKGGIHDP